MSVKIHVIIQHMFFVSLMLTIWPQLSQVNLQCLQSRLSLHVRCLSSRNVTFANKWNLPKYHIDCHAPSAVTLHMSLCDVCCQVTVVIRPPDTYTLAFGVTSHHALSVFSVTCTNTLYLPGRSQLYAGVRHHKMQA